MAAGRTIAIGDIHGCIHALRALLPALELTAEDTLITLGDAVDKGSSSREVVELLLEVRDLCNYVPILGNHEQMLLDAVEGRIMLQSWLMCGGAPTLDSYGKDSALTMLPEEHVDFISSWRDYYETELHFFVHANYHSRQPLGKQRWEELRWRSLKDYVPDRHACGKTAVVGHTAQKDGEIADFGHLICIDTYCHGGQWLTALEPETGAVWQANENGDIVQS
ncbi:MAG: metallophosphoesterase family protein [Planctomycetota bacterium]